MLYSRAMETPVKKKVLICITKGNWGGAQRYVFDLATNLPKEHYDVTVVLGGAGALNQKLLQKNIHVISLPSLGRDVRLLADLESIFGLAKIFKVEKPDVIHLNSSKMGLLGGLAGRLARVPKIIFTAHGWAFNEDRNPLAQIAIKWLHGLTIHLCHHTIVVSEKTKHDITSPALLTKMTVVYNGLPPLHLDAANLAKGELVAKINEINPKLTDLYTKTWIGTISELHQNKGLKYAFCAIKELVINHPDLIFVVIGEGEERQSLEAMITDLGLTNNVFLVGRIDNASRLINAFDIFTLSSTTEAFPYVILEAGQAARPIVASAVGGIPEIITDRVSGLLVKPKSSKDLTQALTLLIENPEKRTTYGQAVAQKVTTTFSLDHMITETAKIY